VNTPTSIPLLELENVQMRYGPVYALKGASFHINPGEIVGLVGDNGAGKSTLVRIMSGAQQPTAGVLKFEGHQTSIVSPLEARKLGIETVYQDLAILPQMDVETNLYLGREINRKSWWNSWLLDKPQMRAEARRHIGSLKVNIGSVRQQVGLLSGGQRQSIAVARAISWGHRLVIMDEPTAALGVRESSGVLDLIRRVRDRGIAIVLVSHNMPHVFELTDRIVVVRHGRIAGNLTTRDTSMNTVVSLITGATAPDAAS
jgi:fructose transport system ATP-binding protein